MASTTTAARDQPPASVTARCRLRPTEDPVRVAKAITSLFPGCRVTTTAESVEGRTGDLHKLKAGFERERIRDTALTAFRKALDHDPVVLRFRLHRQTAFVGRPSFSIGHPLGDIEVEIESPEQQAMVQWLTDGGTRGGRWGDDDEDLRDG